MVKLTAESKISFEDIFGADGQDLSVEKLENLLDRLIEDEAQKSDADPNELIRVVHEGEVIWVTAEQAGDFLKESSTDGEEANLRRNVERSLKGNRQILQQELLLLLALATSTFERNRKANLVGKQEAERVGPALKRREGEIHSTFRDMAAVERKIELYRKQQPILVEYEQRMGELLNAQQAGDLDTAREIAGKLVTDKRQYVLLSRALQPDVSEAYYHRLQSQKIKKKILGTQKEMVVGRGQSLQLEITDLHNRFKKIKSDATAQAADQSSGPVNLDEAREKLAQTREAIEERVKEFEIVKKEAHIISKQEAETDAVISHIAENVLGDTELAVDVDKQVQRAGAKKSAVKKPTAAPKAAKTTGMATSDRRR